MVGSCKWPVSRTRSGFILYTTAATAVFANEPLRSQFRRPTPHYGCDNLLTLPRFPIPRVTQSVGVRVGSGSHLLSGLKPTFTVGDRKPWHEQLNLLLITGTAPRSSLRTCMHGRCTQVSILPNTLLGSSLGTGRSHGGCFHRCLGNIPLPRREWSQDWLTALRYAWSVLLPTSPCELYFYFLCHQRILLGLTLIWVPALLYLIHMCRKKSLPRSRRRSDHSYTPTDSITPVRRCERVSNMAVSRTYRPVIGTSIFAPGSRWLLALILLTQVCNICGAPVFTSESPAQPVPSSAHRVPDTAHPAYSFARKRSYKRAVRRAAQSGDQHTYYRGRVCTLQQLCRGYQGRQAPPTASRRLLQATMSRTQNRLLTLTWNARGLTQALWQELLLTLAHMRDADRPQIVCIQQTHWTAAVAANFRTTGWEVYTSPTTIVRVA